jgi:cellulose synthase/poly-beta-1,6-N-acetylglucosamine synthase-like glycosyltransferase
VCFVPEPVCWTEAPETLKVLRRQRVRWARGLFEILTMHGRMIGRPSYGTVGMAAMPATLMFELLGPVIELTGLVAVVAGWRMGMLSVRYLAIFALVSVVFGLFLSVTALALEEASLRRYPRVSQVFILVIYSLVEQLGYRQLTALWRVWALLEAIAGRRARWGVMKRRGLARKAV